MPSAESSTPIPPDATVFPEGCERLTAQRHEVDGRVFATIVGFDAEGVARWTACPYWDSPRSEWLNDPPQGD